MKIFLLFLPSGHTTTIWGTHVTSKHVHSPTTISEDNWGPNPIVMNAACTKIGVAVPLAIDPRGMREGSDDEIK